MNISRLIIGSLAISLLVASSFAVGAELRTFAIHNLHFEKFKAHGHDAEAVIHAVHEDRKGRLWIGSEAALYLYDGHEVRSFVHAPEQYSGLPNNFAKSIAEAPNGTIWIGTWGGGLAWFDEATRKIRVPRMTTGEVGNKPFDQKVWSMLVDRNGIVWLGTFSSGLFRFDPDTDELKAVWQPGEGDDPRAARIDSLFLDDADNLWFSPYGGGIRVIDTGSGLDAEGVDVEQLNSVSRDVSDIAAFPDGRVVVSYRSAFAVFDQEGHKLLAVDVPLANKDGVIMEALPYGENQVLFGAGNRLWFADIATGVSFPLPAGARPGAVDESIIWDMDVTFDGDLLVAGTHGVSISTAPSRQFWTLALLEGGGDFFNITRAIEFDGTHLYLNSSQSLYQIEFDGQFGQPRVLQGQKLMDVPFGRPLSMRTAPGEGYWAGTDRALYFVDAINTPHTVLEQPTHNMLFDAQYNRLLLHPPGGIRAVSAATPNQPSAEHEDEAELDRRRLSALRLSFGANSDIWAGTFTSLHRYDRDTLESLPAFTPHVEGDGWNGSLVGHIEPIDGGQILLGTSTGPYLAETNDEGAIHRLKHLFANSRLGTVSFSGVFPLGDNRYIMFSDLGFVRFSLENESPPELLSNFDGIPFYRPYIGGFRRFEGGLAVFSGEEGPLLIKPAELDFSVPQRQLVVTDILSFRGDSTETWPITDNLKFRHEDKVIRFRFGMLDHLSADNNEFQIRLKGFAEDWLDLGRVSEFSFTNLDPGEYVLEIRGIDGGLRVPEVETLSFTVLPPWWQTWWAYTLYALVIFGSLFLYWLSLQRKIVREKEISGRLREADRIKSHFLNELESKVEDATRDLRHAVEALEIKNVELGATQQRAIDASRLKSEFLANMSHEIRTPMNGVLGFTQLLQKSDLDNDQRDYVETIDKSAKSLLGIINDVLDVSKIEAGKLIIDSSGFDLRSCIADTLEALAPVAYEKNLELIAHVDASLPDGLRADPTRLRQMLTNLVGNAIKFTDSGHICVRVDKSNSENRFFRISVADTGRGITADDQDRLFNAFERGSVNLEGRYTGTGLGLVITKKLCEAMGGRIELESVPGRGTSVVLELPLVVDRNPENRYGFGKPLAGRKVLVIDPHTQSREALRARLVHWGADVSALADHVEAATEGVDLVVIGVERIRLGDTRGLNALCEKLPKSLPRICLAATVDRDALRSLAEACGANCVSKIGHLESQLRRISEALGIHVAGTRTEEAGSTRLHGLNVLVADDNRINRYFLKKILELHGAHVTEVDSGNGVLRTLDGLSDTETVDIALLDVHMPDMDGLEVARRIRSGGNVNLPLLAVSANVQAETYEAAISSGINDYLLKPVEETKLVEAVLEWTGREAVTSDE